MARDPRAFLWDAVTSAETILGFVAGRSEADYVADAMLRAAVERHFEIIGEALGRLAKATPDIAAQIPRLADVVAFRNLLIHGYAKVDDLVVWRTTQEDLPRLRVALTSCLARLSGTPEVD